MPKINLLIMVKRYAELMGTVTIRSVRQKTHAITI